MGIVLYKEMNMKKNKYIKSISTITALALSASVMTISVQATPSSEELKEEQAAVQSQVNALESQLKSIVAKIESLRKEIATTEENLVKAGEELEEAEVQEYEQYEAMKLRIRYMYEESTSSIMMEKIIKAKSITDMLNQVEYVSDVHSYDRDMLAKYVELKELVLEKHLQFEIELLNLEEANLEVQEQQKELASLLSSKEAEVAALDTQIAAAVQAEIEEAARIKAAQEAAAAAAALAQQQAQEEAQNNNTNNSTNGTTNGTTDNGSSDTSNNTSSSSVTGQQIVNYALKYVGNPYVYGGTSLTNGIDCSAFTQAVYRAFGYSLPRTSTAQRSAGVAVSYSNAQAGDIICYSGHVAIYMGNGVIVHASNSKPYPSGGIKTSPATYTTIIGVRRIL